MDYGWSLDELIELLKEEFVLPKEIIDNFKVKLEAKHEKTN
jgi:hypothetical protein